MPRPAVTAPAMAFLIGLVVLLVSMTPCLSAELDDSDLFVEAFNAFQKQDYLLTIQKIDLLTEVFPDSPLRDISLLLLARAGFKSGDNALAAKTVIQFNSEFAESPLKASIEDELKALSLRKKAGEMLKPNKMLREKAQRVRDSRNSLDQALALKAEKEHLAKEEAEKEETERKRFELAATEKRAKEAINLSIEPSTGITRVAVGKEGEISFNVTNKGENPESFLITIPASKEYAVLHDLIEKSEVPMRFAPGEKRNITMKFKMPADGVDGSKKFLKIKATSSRYSDVSFSGETFVIASAPLLRAVAKPDKKKVSPGENINYRISVLNAGSIDAGGLMVQVVLPEQLKLIAATGAEYRNTAAGIVTFALKNLEGGNYTNMTIRALVREEVKNNQELRIQIELVNGQLQRKELFTSTPVLVQGK